MTLKARFALLLGLFLGGFVAAILGVRALQNGERDKLLADERQTRARLLQHWIEATGRELPQFVAELAQSPELGAVFSGGADTGLQSKLAAALETSGLSAAWILRANGSVSVQATAGGGAPSPPPLETAEFLNVVAETPSPRFFAAQGRELIEIAIRRVQPAGPAGPGWVMVMRKWDEARLRALENLMEARVTLRAAHEFAHPPGESDRIVLLRPLPDWQGRTVRLLRIDADPAEIEHAIQADTRVTRVFVFFGLAIVAAMAIAVHRWVLRPLHQIAASLAADNPQPVHSLATERTELGRVAQLVTGSFAQRHALQQEVEQRIRIQSALERSEAELRQNLEARERLGRDLHDGVIQSLYAAGMGLAGVRVQLHPDQKEAAVRLEQTRAVLNETIHDVRNFIVGLEPEAFHQQTFSQAVAALLESMSNMRPFRSTVKIEENLARRLSLAQRVHALQIAREAVSNALRHGAASAITVSLRACGDSVEFEVADDGAGFDPASTNSPGKGLANFVQRAHELGAELTVRSQPGGGARVNLTFSLIKL